MHLYVLNDDPPTHIVAEEDPIQPDPMKIRLLETGVARVWGTTGGRGQLCLEGPQSDTVVDVEPPGGEIMWLYVRRRNPVGGAARAAWAAALRVRH